MVTYRYLSDKLLKPRHQKLPEEPREQGREEPWKEGWRDGWKAGWREAWKEGREELRRQWAAWNQRRLEAEQNGELFNEPPPGSEQTQH